MIIIILLRLRIWLVGSVKVRLGFKLLSCLATDKLSLASKLTGLRGLCTGVEWAYNDYDY